MYTHDKDGDTQKLEPKKSKKSTAASAPPETLTSPTA